MDEIRHAREYSFVLRERADNSPIGKILKGSIDTHIHFGPDHYA